ncbi:MAG: anhydro-N-acetylmuramic acid kinase [Rhodospirillaceae bacterium]
MTEFGEQRRLRAIGLMSGTSADGIDAAMLETDGDTVFAFGPTLGIEYDAEFRQRLRALMGRPPDGSAEGQAVMRELTLRHADAVRALLGKAGMAAEAIDLVGFHGQTVFHAPDDGITCQLGGGALLAKETGIPVVCDFRSADVAAGGEGAPLVPVFHAALSRTLERPVAMLNIGGVANVTWISPDGGVLAFDTGPGGALIDDWAARHTNRALDADGALARSGRCDEERIETWLGGSYFTRAAPKSLDRDTFAEILADLEDMSPADGAATLTAFSAAAVAAGARLFPAQPLRWLVTGGGRHNPVLMAELRRRLGVPVEPVEAVGWDGDTLEAQAFAFLAVRSVFGQALTYPQTTGVTRPTRGGVLFRAG